MLVDWTLPAAMALGHLCLAILLVNVVHGFGVGERAMGRLMAAIVVAFAASSAGLILATRGESWPAWPWPVRVYAVACLAVALVGLPLSTVARWLRKPPRG